MEVVSFRHIDNFASLPEKEAEEILYNQLVPKLETKGVKLSFYGNHAALESLETIKTYEERKEQKELFDISRIQTCFRDIGDFFQETKQFSKTTSYDFKHIVEDSQDEYLTNGDLIATMLLKGYKACFRKRGENRTVNCTFNAKLRGENIPGDVREKWLIPAPKTPRNQNKKELPSPVISYPRVVNFDTMSDEDAEKILYDELLPFCKDQGIYLSRNGNDNSPSAMRGSEFVPETYEKRLSERHLFDIKRVKTAYREINQYVKPVSQYQGSSYGMKGQLERKTSYLSNGDFIVAMLLHGYSARFYKRGEAPSLNAMFKAKIIEERPRNYHSYYFW